MASMESGAAMTGLVILALVYVALAVLGMIAFFSLVRLFFFLGHASGRHTDIVGLTRNVGIQLQQLNEQIAHLNNQVGWQNQTLAARRSRQAGTKPQSPGD